ncbi:MAG: T9SS type A sorting domain-containing protein [Bacteroidota bacterium]
MKKVYLLLMLAALMFSFSEKSTAQSPGSLPGLVTISADIAAGNKVVVSWTMLAKVNTDLFDVEKSSDGINWRSIATVKSENDTIVPFTYTSLDMSPLKGSNFYKVRLKDMNGNFTSTAIKRVWVNASGSINIFPNPSSNLINISLGQVAHANWSISIINDLGQIIEYKKYNKNITAVKLAVNNYPAGNYTVEVIEDNFKQSNRLLINHN